MNPSYVFSRAFWLALVGLVYPSVVFAFTYGDGVSPCRRFIPPCTQRAYSGVFIGRLVRTVQNPLSEWATNGSVFLVVRAFRGLDADTITVWTSGPCEPPYVVGEDYLVYAAMLNPAPSASAYTDCCSGTRSLANAAADIAYLEEVAASPSSSHIHGWVARVEGDSGGFLVGVGGVRIVATSRGQQWVAQTDHDGYFDIGQLPDGTYQVSSDSLRHFVIDRIIDTVRVEGHGCAEVFFFWYPAVEHHGDGEFRAPDNLDRSSHRPEGEPSHRGDAK